MEGEMMFEKMLRWLRRTLNTYFESKGAQPGILLSDSMESAIAKWSAMYEGVPIKGGSPPIGIAAAICAELARMVAMESQITAAGGARADYIMRQLGEINLQNAVELACALGGVAFKPDVYKRQARLLHEPAGYGKIRRALLAELQQQIQPVENGL